MFAPTWEPLLVGPGLEVTSVFVERARNCGPDLLNESIKVLVQAGRTTSWRRRRPPAMQWARVSGGVRIAMRQSAERSATRRFKHNYFSMYVFSTSSYVTYSSVRGRMPECNRQTPSKLHCGEPAVRLPPPQRGLSCLMI